MSIFSRNSPIAYHKLWILVLILSLFILGGLSIAQERGPLSPVDTCTEGEYVVITTNGLECKPIPSATQQLIPPSSCNEGEVVSFVANADGSVTGECGTPRTPYGLSLSEYSISLVPNGIRPTIQLPLTNRLLPECERDEIVTFDSLDRPVCDEKEITQVACSSGQYLAGISGGVPDCRSLPPAYTPPATAPPATVSLYREQHTTRQCEGFNGSVTTIGGVNFCVFSRSTCPSGWTKYKNYTRTVSNTCRSSICESSCRTRSHSSFSNIFPERCRYSSIKPSEYYVPEKCTPGGKGEGERSCSDAYYETRGSCRPNSAFCTAIVVSIGCY